MFLAFACLATLGSAPAHGASKTLVAAIGDAAPGGGLFAGPSFNGWPAAAGAGWIAFRGEVAQGGTSEALIVAHRTPPTTRVQVASIGQAAPEGGTFKQFVGRPAVNANGDVAFLALLTRSDDLDDPNAPTPAGIFLFRHGELRAVARAGQTVAGAGRLDLVAPSQSSDPNADDLPERSPSLNDAGEVAFFSALRDNPQASGALFLAAAGAQPTVVVRVGDAYDGGMFTALGPPALNNHGVLAFHGRATTDDAADNDGIVDGIFSFARGVSVMVRDGQIPMGVSTPLHDFDDSVALNDRGDVAFVAGPVFDDDDAPAHDDRTGVLACRGGVLYLLAGSGKTVGGDRVTGIRLGTAAGSQLTSPALAPDGSVAFFARVRGEKGSGEVIAVWDGTKTTSTAVAGTSGASASTSPAGGTYNGAESAPAIDGNGAVVFLARIVGGSSSEAIVYQPRIGEGVPVVVGDAAPSGGFFAGRPFSAPLLNDRGDVVFRAFVARSEASVGIFRYRAGRLDAVVRGGDPSPADDRAPFDDLLGQPSLNGEGTIAFAAHLADKVGIFVAEAGGLRTVAVTGDPAPGQKGTKFLSFGLNPSINDDGAVAFRATTVFKDSDGTRRRESIFLADTTGIRALASVGDMTSTGVPFLRLREPTLSNLPNVAFRASLGEKKEVASGLFLADDRGVTKVAVEKDDLGGGVTLSGFSGDAAMSPIGDLAFLVTRSRVIGAGLRRALGPAILRRSVAQLAPVIAQDMPGPAGGTFRNLGQPGLSSLGHLAFRGSFLPLTGGTPGLFLATEEGLEPYLTLGEGTSLKGRISQVSSRPSLNADDDVAFTATVSGGTARSGIFLASRTTLEVQALTIRLGRRSRDRIKLRLLLRAGRTSAGFDPQHETVTVSLADTKGALWSATVPGSNLKRRGKALVATPRRGASLGLVLRSLRLEVPQRNTVRTTVTSATIDLTRSGQRPLAPPFTATLQISDDSGAKIAPCEVRKRGVRCKVV